MKRVYSIAAAIILSACATSADVRTTMVPGANLEKFRTFAFVQGDVQSPDAIGDKLARERLQHLIALHLGKRGYTPAPPGQAADLGVHYVGQVDTAQRELMTGYPGLYQIRRGDVDVGGVATMQYRKGTLVIDLFDRAEKRLLWRATITEAFSTGYTEENWAKVDRALEEAFRSLPARR